MIGALCLFALVAVGFGLTILIARQGQHDWERQRLARLTPQMQAIADGMLALNRAAISAGEAARRLSDAMKELHL